MKTTNSNGIVVNVFDRLNEFRSDVIALGVVDMINPIHIKSIKEAADSAQEGLDVILLSNEFAHELTGRKPLNHSGIRSIDVLGTRFVERAYEVDSYEDIGICLKGIDPSGLIILSGHDEHTQRCLNTIKQHYIKAISA